MQKFELLLFFAWRDLLVRYKQALLGILWALIRPLLNMVLFVIIFNKIASIETLSPYPLFVLAGLIPWQFMASTLQSASMSLIQNTTLIQKASFPRIFLPMSTLIVNAVDCLISLLVLFVFCNFSMNALYFPLFLALLFLLGLSLSLWCSAIAVRIKDLIIAIPYLVQVGIFISPIGFTIDRFPQSVQSLFLLNPLVGIIDGFRWSLLDEVNPFMAFTIPYSIGVTFLSLISGYRFFRKVETHIADTL